MGSKNIYAADLFCGAGGTSTGLIQASADLGLNVELTAIDHWDVAIETHSHNHPGARHLCESLDNVDPRKLFPGERLHLLVASPECTHHSRARGGRPCSDQSRATAWHIVRWASSLYIDNIIIENVPEFMSWGPLGVKGQPLQSRKGALFLSFVNALESIGYRCEWRTLNTANYGDATCRRRFFMLCRRGNKRIEWPDCTHSEVGGENLFGTTRAWVPARDVIDWSLPGESIFSRKKPLSPRTIARIVHGLQKFGGPSVEPFLVMLYGAGKSRSVDMPMPTVTAGGGHIALCEPFLIPQQAGGKDQLRVRSVTKPFPSLTTKGAEALVEPFLIPVDHASMGARGARSVKRPMPTVITQQSYGLVQPFLIKYYGASNSASLDGPLDTITTRDTFGLVQPQMGPYMMDIKYRMLQPHELAAAHSFPQTYRFVGKKTEVVKQIGNSVPVLTAQSLCTEALRPYAKKEAA